MHVRHLMWVVVVFLNDLRSIQIMIQTKTYMKYLTTLLWYVLSAYKHPTGHDIDLLLCFCFRKDCKHDAATLLTDLTQQKKNR